MSRSVYDIREEGKYLAAFITTLPDEDQQRLLDERVGQWECDSAVKLLRLRYAEDTLVADLAGMQGEVRVMKNAEQGLKGSIKRVRQLQVEIMHARQALLGEKEGRAAELQNGQTAFLVQRETAPKFSVDKGRVAELPPHLQVMREVVTVDMAKLKELPADEQQALVDSGVVTRTWTDGTHVRFK
jgi:hypothetical protein